MRQIRSVVGATVINPELLTATERLRYEAYLRREETNTAVMALFKDGRNFPIAAPPTVRSSSSYYTKIFSILARTRWIGWFQAASRTLNDKQTICLLNQPSAPGFVLCRWFLLFRGD